MSRDLTRRDALRAGLAVATVLLISTASAQTKATVIAGSTSDALIARHVRLSGSQRDIGKALAVLAQGHGGITGKVSPEEGRKRAAWFRTHWPELIERGQGAANQLGVDPKDASQDIYSVSYNTRAPFGCSCSYYPPERTTTGHALLSRNYDFSTGTLAELSGRPKPPGVRGFTADPYLIECRPEKGFDTLMMVSYDILAGCIDGINEHGLAVALLADDQARTAVRAEGPEPGLGEIEVPRFFLERCRNVEECIALAKIIPYYFTFIPCHYIVGDATGRSAVIEWEASSKKLHIVEGARRPQVVTNHLLSTNQDGMNRADDGPGGSFTRYKKLRKAIDPRAKLSKAEIIKFHQSVMPPGGSPVNRPVGRTLWHSLYDLKERSLSISFYLRDQANAPMGQVRTPYRKFTL